MKALRKRNETDLEKRFIIPNVDIKEENNRVLLTTELPGIDKDHLHVEIENNTLTILAEQPEDIKGYTVLFSERPERMFRRVFSLDDSIDASNIDASLNNGVLTLTLQKAEKALPKRIDVKIE